MIQIFHLCVEFVVLFRFQHDHAVRTNRPNFAGEAEGLGIGQFLRIANTFDFRKVLRAYIAGGDDEGAEVIPFSAFVDADSSI